MFEENIKHFFLIINKDTTVNKKIDVVNPRFKTARDLKLLIQNELGISMDKFDLNGIKEYDRISTITNKFILVEFKKICSNIIFRLPNDKRVELFHCANDNFDELILKFKREGYYFTKKCSNNLYFKIFDFKYPHTCLTLNFIPEGKEVQVINEKSISIEFENKTFYFESGEFIPKAEIFISDTLELKFKTVKIHACNQNITYKNFIQGEKYSISILRTFKFIDPNGKSVDHLLDVNATVGDAKKSLVTLCSKDSKLTQADIIICEGDEKITSDEVKLNELNNLHFNISINKSDISNDSRPKSAATPKEIPNLKSTTTPKEMINTKSTSIHTKMPTNRSSNSSYIQNMPSSTTNCK